MKDTLTLSKRLNCTICLINDTEYSKMQVSYAKKFQQFDVQLEIQIPQIKGKCSQIKKQTFPSGKMSKLEIICKNIVSI